MKYLFKVSQIYKNQLYKISSFPEFIDEEEYNRVATDFYGFIDVLIMSIENIKKSLSPINDSIINIEINNIFNYIKKLFNGKDFFTLSGNKGSLFYLNLPNISFPYFDTNDFENNRIIFLNKILQCEIYLKSNNSSNFEIKGVISYHNEYYFVKNLQVEILKFFISFLEKFQEIFVALDANYFEKKIDEYNSILNQELEKIKNQNSQYEKEQTDLLMQDLMGEDYEDEELRKAFRKGKYF